MSENSLNPLDPESPLRSKRVQGAAITLGVLVATLLGFKITPTQEGAILNLGNELVMLAGLLWNQVGGIMASKSPRNF